MRSQSDFSAAAAFIARFYGEPATETIRKPAIKRTVEEPQTVRRSVERPHQVETASPAPIVILVAGILGSLALLAVWAPGVVIGLAVSIVAFYIGKSHLRRTRTEMRTVEETQTITVSREVLVEPERTETRVIPNRYEVTALGWVDVPLCVLQVNGVSLLLTPQSIGESVTARFPLVTNMAGARDTMQAIDKQTREAPYVLNQDSQSTGAGLRGEEADLHALYMDAARLFSDVCSATHELRVVAPSPVLLAELKRDEAARTCHGAAHAFDQQLHGEDGEAFDSACLASMRLWARRQAIMHAARTLSLHDGIAPVCRNLGQMFEYSSFYFYCPHCTAEANAELLERDYSVVKAQESPPVIYSRNARCVFDPTRRVWRCTGCEQETDAPIPIHRMLDDVFLPAYDRLMEENKNERLAVYADARNHELQYQNQHETELDSLIRENRTQVEQHRAERKAHEADIAGEQTAIQSLTNVMTSYNIHQSSALEQVLREGVAIRDRVLAEQRDVEQRIERDYGIARQEMVRAMTGLAHAQYVENEKRDQVQRSIAMNMAVTAVATVQTAQHTGRIAVATETTAANTGRIAVATERTAVATERTAANTDRIAVSTEQTASSTGRIAANTDAMKATLKESNYIQAAMARKAGVSIGPSPFNPIGQMKLLAGNLVNTVTLQDDVAKARTRMEARS